eukprot:1158439-Pelagomonas_calceolata.AAC.9
MECQRPSFPAAFHFVSAVATPSRTLQAHRSIDAALQALNIARTPFGAALQTIAAFPPCVVGRGDSLYKPRFSLQSVVVH